MGVVYFVASDSRELWRTAGTPGSTQMVRRYDESIIATLHAVGNLVFLSAVSGTGVSVWASDGSTAGTIELRRGLPPGGGDLPGNFSSLGSQVLFAADDGVSGVELWRTDGTPAGTVLLKDLKPGPDPSGIAGLSSANGLVFFSALSGTQVQLWRSDGTSNGTFPITQLPGGVTPSYGPSHGHLRAVGNNVFFVGRDEAGSELWRSDGTSAGTYRVADICPGPCDSGPSEMVSMDGVVYFTAMSESFGREVWRSDGTPSGTRVLKDIRPGTGSGVPWQLTPVGRLLYFVADDGVAGTEIWLSDGTEAGTRLAFELTPGSGGTPFEWLAAATHGLYFATSGKEGARHLWFEPVTQPPAPSGRLINLSGRARVMTGDDVAIAGFIIGGGSNKTVMLRARGPSLATYGVEDALRNPIVQLFRSSDGELIAANDDWATATNALAVEWTGLKPTDPRESAILISLPPGGYTAVVSGVEGTQGIGIVEVFEMAQPEVPLINISTRARIQTGDNVLIGGLIIGGAHPKTVLLRGRGPSLAEFGLADTLANPQIQLVRQDQTVVASNDDWQQAINAPAIRESGFAPSNAAEAAILVTLPPGGYTVVMSGVRGTSGVGIVEVFEVP
jgi:ELWxxDGT repeat protein